MIATGSSIAIIMTNTIITNYVSAVVAGLLKKVDTLRELEHQPTNSTINEIFVSELFEEFLPSQLGTGSGIIVNSKGSQSRETDVIIYDNRTMRPFLRQGGKSLFPVESVLATIEVKTSLTLAHIREFEENAKHLCESIWTYGDSIFRPTCFLFAFSGSVPTDLHDETEGKRWLEQNAQYLAGICLVGTCSWMLMAKMDKMDKVEWVGKLDGFETYEEVKRFPAVIIDNIRKIAEWRWRSEGIAHHDWLGAYIRDQ